MKLARRVRGLKPSPTLSLTAKAKALKASGRDVVDLCAGEPDFETPDNVKRAGIKAIEEGFTRYTPVGGIDELKDAIIEKLKRDNGLEYSREEIIVSCGAKHVLYNIAQALFEEGDEVIIPAPYWVSYPEIVALAGAEPVILPTLEDEGFKVTPQEIKGAITERTKAIIINSPSNPTGIVYTEEELSAIYDVIRDTDIVVISDEIYEKLTYDSHEFFSFASLCEDAKERTIVVNGLSKSHSMTGWRIGYGAGRKEWIKAMINIQSQSTSNPSSIAQKAAVEALKGPQDALERMVEEFDRRRRYILERLNSMDGVRCTTPRGAFYVFPSVRGAIGRTYRDRMINSSKDLAELLLEEAMVAVVPGEAFGADGYIRISYATGMEDLKKGLDRIENFLNHLE